MGNKELDALIESYFKSADSLSQTNDVLSFEMLTEIIEEVIEDFQPTKKAIKEGRLPPDQWKELYRKLLMVGVDSDMVEELELRRAVASHECIRSIFHNYAKSK